VEDLYEGEKATNWANEKIYRKLIKESLGEKEILRQATEGVAFLHALGFVHRNLKPSNFMIAQLQQFRCDRFRYLIKLSDFRMSKNPVECPSVSGTTGSKGWTYPNLPNTEVDSSTYQRGDVFILGCFFHYVLTNGKHPFDDNSDTRRNNINNSKYFVYRDNWNPKDPNIGKEAIALLKDMIKFQLKDICTLDEIFRSRYFSPVNFYQLYDLPLPIVKPGLCVIINQEIFETVINFLLIDNIYFNAHSFIGVNFFQEGNNRTGTNFDEDSLKCVFMQLGFDVRIFKDLKAKNLCYCVEDLARQDFSSYASLVVCILSHGDEGVVEGVDGESIKINALKYKFNSNDCPTLNGKPKIWIIQACQGKGIQYPIQTNGSKGIEKVIQQFLLNK
jgi:serine/threonine protein kinase